MADHSGKKEIVYLVDTKDIKVLLLYLFYTSYNNIGLHKIVSQLHKIVSQHRFTSSTCLLCLIINLIYKSPCSWKKNEVCVSDGDKWMWQRALSARRTVFRWVRWLLLLLYRWLDRSSVWGQGWALSEQYLWQWSWLHQSLQWFLLRVCVSLGIDGALLQCCFYSFWKLLTKYESKKFSKQFYMVTFYLDRKKCVAGVWLVWFFYPNLKLSCRLIFFFKFCLVLLFYSVY